MLLGHSLGDESGRLLAVDPQICEILQRRESELLGRRYREFTHPDDVERNTRIVDLLRTGDGPVEFTKRYVRPDGSTVFAKIRVSRLAGADGARLLGTIETLPCSVAPGVAQRWQAATATAAALRQRRAELGGDLVGDLAYALLLETYLAEAEGRLIGLDALAAELGASPAVTERWLRVLTGRGLIEPTAGATPQLTFEGLRKVERLLDLSNVG